MPVSHIKVFRRLQCYKMVQETEVEQGSQYKWITMSRPDVAWFKHAPSFAMLSNETAIIGSKGNGLMDYFYAVPSSFAHDWYGNSDRSTLEYVCHHLIANGIYIPAPRKSGSYCTVWSRFKVPVDAYGKQCSANVAKLPPTADGFIFGKVGR